MRSAAVEQPNRQGDGNAGSSAKEKAEAGLAAPRADDHAQEDAQDQEKSAGPGCSRLHSRAVPEEDALRQSGRMVNAGLGASGGSSGNLALLAPRPCFPFSLPDAVPSPKPPG